MVLLLDISLAAEASDKEIPYLHVFVLIMEFWSIHIELAMASGRIHPI